MQGRVVLVTGANKGIGFEIVRKLCRSTDWNIILAARSTDRGGKAIHDITSDKSIKAKLEFLQLDISDEASVKQAVACVKEKYGGLDVLVNNAGMAYKNASTAPFEEQATVTVETNYFGTVRVIEDFWPIIRSGGRIVNVSSSAGNFNKLKNEKLRKAFLQSNIDITDVDKLMKAFVNDVKEGRHENEGWPNSAYAVSKMGVTAVTRAFAQRAAREHKDIAVVCCCPGWCRTDMAGQRAPKSAEDGADTPVWLAIEADGKTVHGAFVQDRKVLNPDGMTALAG